MSDPSILHTYTPVDGNLTRSLTLLCVRVGAKVIRQTVLVSRSSTFPAELSDRLK